MSTCKEPHNLCAISRLPKMMAPACKAHTGTGSKSAGTPAESMNAFSRLVTIKLAEYKACYAKNSEVHSIRSICGPCSVGTVLYSHGVQFRLILKALGIAFGECTASVRHITKQMLRKGY